MATIQQFESNRKTVFSEQTRKKLSLALLGLIGIACVVLLVLLGQSM